MKDTVPKVILDIASIFVVGGTLLEMLPHIAALFTIVWTALRIYEMIEARWKARREKEDKT